MIVPTSVTFNCIGNDIFVPSVNIEKHVIYALLRAELSCCEGVTIYRTEQKKDEFLEQLCKFGTLEGWNLIFVLKVTELQKTDSLKHLDMGL